MVCTSTPSLMRLRARGLLSTTTTSLASEARRLAMWKPTSPAPMMMIFTLCLPVAVAPRGARAAPVYRKRGGNPVARPRKTRAPETAFSRTGNPAAGPGPCERPCPEAGASAPELRATRRPTPAARPESPPKAFPVRIFGDGGLKNPEQVSNCEVNPAVQRWGRMSSSGSFFSRRPRACGTSTRSAPPASPKPRTRTPPAPRGRFSLSHVQGPGGLRRTRTAPDTPRTCRARPADSGRSPGERPGALGGRNHALAIAVQPDEPPPDGHRAPEQLRVVCQGHAQFPCAQLAWKRRVNPACASTP